GPGAVARIGFVIARPGWRFLKAGAENNCQQPPTDSRHEDAGGGEQQLVEVQGNLEAAKYLGPGQELPPAHFVSFNFVLGHGRSLCQLAPSSMAGRSGSALSEGNRRPDGLPESAR